MKIWKNSRKVETMKIKDIKTIRSFELEEEHKSLHVFNYEGHEDDLFFFNGWEIDDSVAETLIKKSKEVITLFLDARNQPVWVWYLNRFGWDYSDVVVYE